MEARTDVCSKCTTDVAIDNNGKYVAHNSQACYLLKFRKVEAPKYGMVSIFDALKQPKYSFDYVAGNLANIYPKLASKPIRVNGSPVDLFVEAWGADAIRLYIKNDGYGGMCLADFIDKMAGDRYATKLK